MGVMAYTKTTKLFPKNHENYMKYMSIVRLKKSKMKFELICYKNKNPSERNDLELIVHEIVQIPIIYTSVAKGQIAKPKDLQNVFKTKNNFDIILEILQKGEQLQTSMDRQCSMEKRYSYLGNMVHNICVHSGSKNQFELQFIFDALRYIDYKVIHNKTKTEQLNDMISHLQRVLPIERASNM